MEEDLEAGETLHLITDVEPGSDALSLSISGSTLFISARTMRYSREVPPLGFTTQDLTHTSTLTGIGSNWLVNQLNREEHRDAAGWTVRMLAMISHLEKRHTACDPPAPDTECVICLQKAEDTQGMEWSIGCRAQSIHRFHTHCISRWKKGSCPLCRAE